MTTSFLTYDATSKTVTIDGSSRLVIPTTFPDGKAVQLRRARQEESGFQWCGKAITHVIVKNVLIYDRIDLACLNWFLRNGIKINYSESYVSPDCLKNFILTLKDLKILKVKAIEGSIMTIPTMQGSVDIGRMERAAKAARKIGFEVIYS